MIKSDIIFIYETRICKTSDCNRQHVFIVLSLISYLLLLFEHGKHEVKFARYVFVTNLLLSPSIAPIIKFVIPIPKPVPAIVNPRPKPINSVWGRVCINPSEKLRVNKLVCP